MTDSSMETPSIGNITVSPSPLSLRGLQVDTENTPVTSEIIDLSSKATEQKKTWEVQENSATFHAKTNTKASDEEEPSAIIIEEDSIAQFDACFGVVGYEDPILHDSSYKLPNVLIRSWRQLFLHSETNQMQTRFQ